MALDTLQLVDSSVIARLNVPQVAARVESLSELGLVATCSIIDLEMGYSAQSAERYRQIMTKRRALPLAPIDQRILNDALRLQDVLAQRGHHRLPIYDLIIARSAIAHEMAVRHDDKDFDVIASVCDVDSRWVVPRGTV